MVAIGHHIKGPPDAVHERRVRAFLGVYGAVTVAVPCAVVLVWPQTALFCMGAQILLILVEALQLALYVQTGRDEATECRWLGSLILLRLVLQPAACLLGFVVHDAL